jgi:ATP-dependent helicase STH1/SNF2
MILARNDNELVKFQAMDADRAKDPVYGTAPGAKHVPRLMAENELPDIYLSEGNVVDESEDVVLGRGARERNKVKYDDGLTEEQWLMAVDDDDDSPEAAAARKAARKERREQKRLKRMAAGGPHEPSPSGSRASTEEVETPVKKRGRKPGSKNVEKRKVDVDGVVDEEPPAKKRRGPQARPRAVAAPEMAPEVRESLNKSLRRLYDSLMHLEVEFPEPPEKEEGEDEPPMRLIIGPFVKLPSKRDYGDYYMVTKSPIAMNIIDKKIKKGEYRKLSDMKRDIELLCSNCRNYNDDASLLYADANTIEAFFNKQYQQELNDHPELAELEGSGPNTSAGPSTATGTPQPASSGPTRIKLVSNSNGTSQVNGGSSGVQSDEE